jgi:hypothetical protein
MKIKQLILKDIIKNKIKFNKKIELTPFNFTNPQQRTRK